MTFLVADLCSTAYTFEEIAHLILQVFATIGLGLYSGRMTCLFFYMSTLPFLCGKDDIFLYFYSGNNASDHT